MELRCGHDASCELDTICPKCGRYFITPYFPYILGVAAVLLTYYSGNMIKGSYSDKLVMLFISFILFLDVSILRHKSLELITNIFISFPILIVSFEQIIMLMCGRVITHYLLFIAYFLFSIPLILALIFGFNDAYHYNNLRKGSFWLILSLFLSISVSIIYWVIPIIQGLDLFANKLAILKRVFYYIEFVFNYRSVFLAIVVAIVMIISIARSLIKELNVRESKSKTIANTNSNLVRIIYNNISRYTSNLFEALLTGLDLIKQILEIIFIEILTLAKESLIRAILILMRVLRIFFLSFVMFGVAIMLNGVVIYTAKIWSSPSFFTMEFIDWIKFVSYCIALILLIWSFIMLTYKKWRDSINYPLSLRRTFITFFGTRIEALTAHRSITISVPMYLFYLILTFFSAWAIILTTNFIIKLSKPNRIGVLFSLMITIMVILWLVKYIQSKERKISTENEQ